MNQIEKDFKNVYNYHTSYPYINKTPLDIDVQTKLLLKEFELNLKRNDNGKLSDKNGNEIKEVNLTLSHLNPTYTQTSDVNYYSYTKEGRNEPIPYIGRSVAEKEYNYWKNPLIVSNMYNNSRRIKERTINSLINTRLNARDDYSY